MNTVSSPLSPTIASVTPSTVGGEHGALIERLRRMAVPNPQIENDSIRVNVLAPVLNEAADALERASPTIASEKECGKAVGEWRDIASAPKDGTKIDLWSPKLGRMASFYWQRFQALREKPAFECWAGPHGFGPLDNQYPPDRHPNAQPTHWQPLPAPPAKGEGE